MQESGGDAGSTALGPTVTPDQVLKSLMNDGHFDDLRVKILNQLKQNVSKSCPQLPLRILVPRTCKLFPCPPISWRPLTAYMSFYSVDAFYFLESSSFGCKDLSNLEQLWISLWEELGKNLCESISITVVLGEFLQSCCVHGVLMGVVHRKRLGSTHQC